MSNKKITPEKVERDEYGFWTHSAYNEFCAGRQHITHDELNEWLDKNGLEADFIFMDTDDNTTASREYRNKSTFTKWRPDIPEGNGWFIGSIHECEDGPVCVWLRAKQGGDHV